MMIAQYILPTKETTSPKSDCNTKTNNKQTASSTDYSLNTLVSRELMVLKQVKLDVTTLDIALPATALHLSLPCASRSSQSPGILLTVSLIFLFLPLLPRSDIPL